MQAASTSKDAPVSFEDKFSSLKAIADIGQRYLKLEMLQSQVSAEKAAYNKKRDRREKIIKAGKIAFWSVAGVACLAGLVLATPPSGAALIPAIAGLADKVFMASVFTLLGGGLVGCSMTDSKRWRDWTTTEINKDFNRQLDAVTTHLNDIRNNTPVSALLESPRLGDMLNGAHGPALQERIRVAFNPAAARAAEAKSPMQPAADAPAKPAAETTAPKS